MLLEKERKEIVEYGKRIFNQGLTRGTGGNLSVFNRDKNLMAVSPSGIPYLELKPEDVVIIDVQTGKRVDGDKVPSSESDMHRMFYKYRDDIDAMIHTHSKYAMGVSCVGEKLPAIHYLLAVAGVEVPCAEYATYGTIKFARNAFEAMKGCKGALLSNHGALAGGKDLQEAYEIVDSIEFGCELYFIAKTVGTPNILPRDEMERVAERFKDYGKKIEEHEEL